MSRSYSSLHHKFFNTVYLLPRAYGHLKAIVVVKELGEKSAPAYQCGLL